MEFHPYFTHKKWIRLGQNESNRYKRKNPGNSVFPGLSGTFLMKLALGESIENNPISQNSAKSVKSRGSDC
jgi:hypothetical protein